MGIPKLHSSDSVILVPGLSRQIPILGIVPHCRVVYHSRQLRSDAHCGKSRSICRAALEPWGRDYSTDLFYYKKVYWVECKKRTPKVVIKMVVLCNNNNNVT